MEKYIVITFNTTHDSIKSEKIIKDLNMGGRLIPLPPEISAGCGLALRIDEKDMDSILLKFKEENLSNSGVYLMIRENGKRSVKEIV